MEIPSPYVNTIENRNIMVATKASIIKIDPSQKYKNDLD